MDDRVKKQDLMDTNNEQNYLAALENLNTAIMMVDTDLNIIFINHESEKLLKSLEKDFKKTWRGFKGTKDYLIGRCIDQFHQDPSHQRKILKDPQNMPYLASIEVGEVKIQLNVSARINQNGDYMGATLEWSDITQKVASENAVTQLQGAVEGSQTPMMMIDRDLKITYANPATYRLLKSLEKTMQGVWKGFHATEKYLMGKCIDDFHKDPKHQRKILSDPSNLPHKTNIKIGDATIELNVAAIMDAKGNYVGSSLEWSDVTEKVAAENAIARLQGAVEGSQTAMMMVDRDLRITYANPASYELLRKLEDTMQGVWPDFKATEEYLSGKCIDDFHKDPKHQRKILSDPSNLPYKTNIKIGDATIELNVAAIMDAKGNYVGSSLEWSDVTEKVQSENAVARLQGAVEGSQTAMMMVDRDLKITYANSTSYQLLKSLESEMQTIWRGFQATEEYMIGKCIDDFHKNPAHQRKILSDPTNLPYKANINIGEAIIELNVGAIVDAQGNYVGSSLEWSNITEKVAADKEVGRLISAVEGMSTNLMMADPDGFINYMNPSIKKMLRRREKAIQEVFPQFSVESVIGTNFDSFHKNPAHQRSLLHPENLPYQADIKVGPLSFKLIAVALRDKNENYLGTAVEWIDTTDAVSAQEQVENLITLASKGELKERLDSEAFDGFMKNLSSSINTMLNTVVEPIENCQEVLELLAAGDLQKNMDGAYQGMFAQLQKAINSSINNLRKMVNDILEASNNISTSSSEIAQGNIDLSSRTEEQAASLEETASSMEELTSTVRENAESANKVNKIALKAMEHAENGGEVVNEAVQAMQEISDASREIADIIGVIDEIAFQTNLLALNAAVEAARAGEQGRGFAVVATEVRSLAQRSSSAAKDIKTLINNSVRKVEQGSQLVNDSGHKLRDIVISVRNVTQLIQEISTASKEQASGIEQINQSISQMDTMTQQNSALVEQAAAAAESLSDQSDTLMTLMEFFKTDEASSIYNAKPRITTPTKTINYKEPLEVSTKEGDSDWETF